MELNLDKREERRQFCTKLNGLPPNANARDYWNFIEKFYILEFRIPEIPEQIILNYMLMFTIRMKRVWHML